MPSITKESSWVSVAVASESDVSLGASVSPGGEPADLEVLQASTVAARKRGEIARASTARKAYALESTTQDCALVPHHVRHGDGGETSSERREDVLVLLVERVIEVARRKTRSSATFRSCISVSSSFDVVMSLRRDTMWQLVWDWGTFSWTSSGYGTSSTPQGPVAVAGYQER